MGLFNFLKPKQNPQPKSIDEIFDLASKDISYRPLFYRTILETGLYVLIQRDEKFPRGTFTSDENTTLKVRMLSDGTVPLFTSEEKIYDNNVIKEQAAYVVIKGQAIFDMFPNPPRMFLNPYSRPAKEFLPDEIIKLRTGQLFDVDEEWFMKKGATVEIGMPTNYPTELASALKKYSETREEVTEVYLALMRNSQTNEKPNLLIGIKADKNVKEIFGEVAEIIRPNVAKDEPVDMIDLTANDRTAKVLKNKEYLVYKK